MSEENGVTISFKEIYDELLKMGDQINSLVIRVNNIENQLEEESKRRQDFSNSIKKAAITAAIPVALGVVWYVAEQGVFS